MFSVFHTPALAPHGAFRGGFPFGGLRGTPILTNFFHLVPASLLLWLLAALLGGWLAALVVRGHGFGCLGDTLLGLVGGFLAGALLNVLSLQLPSITSLLSFLPGGLALGGVALAAFVEVLLVAFLGAFVLVAIGRLVSGLARGW